MKEAGFLMLTPMDEGVYLIKWLSAVTDKEDKKRLLHHTRRKENPILYSKIGNTWLIEETMPLMCKCEPSYKDEKKASEALPRMPTTKRSMLNDYSES